MEEVLSQSQKNETDPIRFTEKELLEGGAKLERSAPMKDLRQHDREERGVDKFYEEIPAPTGEGEFTTILPSEEELSNIVDSELTDLDSVDDIIDDRKVRKKRAGLKHRSIGSVHDSAAKVAWASKPVTTISGGIFPPAASAGIGMTSLAVLKHYLGSMGVATIGLPVAGLTAGGIVGGAYFGSIFGYRVSDKIEESFSERAEKRYEKARSIDVSEYKIFRGGSDRVMSLIDSSDYIGFESDYDDVFVEGATDRIGTGFLQNILEDSEDVVYAVDMRELTNLEEHEEGYLFEAHIGVGSDFDEDLSGIEETYSIVGIGDEDIQKIYDSLEDEDLVYDLMDD